MKIISYIINIKLNIAINLNIIYYYHYYYSMQFVLFVEIQRKLHGILLFEKN